MNLMEETSSVDSVAITTLTVLSFFCVVSIIYIINKVQDS